MKCLPPKKCLSEYINFYYQLILSFIFYYFIIFIILLFYYSALGNGMIDLPAEGTLVTERVSTSYDYM